MLTDPPPIEVRHEAGGWAWRLGDLEAPYLFFTRRGARRSAERAARRLARLTEWELARRHHPAGKVSEPRGTVRGGEASPRTKEVADAPTP